MGTLHVTGAELVRDLEAVLKKVSQGFEVVIEQDNHPVAVLRPPASKGRMISEVIAALDEMGADAVIDEEFAKDVEEGIEAYRKPWNPTTWD